MPTSLRVLSADQVARALAVRDLSDPAQGRHALQRLIDDVVTSLARVWRCIVHVHRGPRIVSVRENYDALGYAPDAVSRDVRYTRYVGEDHVLRTHTSALVPSGLCAIDRTAADVLLVCPGVVYRRDAIDRLHTGTPHQLDLWRIRRDRRLGAGELEGMIDIVVRTLLPGADHRVEGRTHPYTTDGLQIDIRNGDAWVEIGECGLAGAHVLHSAGIDGTGLAMGLGLDRFLMLRKGIADIRLLRSDDPRVARQMLDLGLYRPVSNHPAISRDLSVAVNGDDTGEDLGDRVRDALGDDADTVEAVEVLGETVGETLPTPARTRLGLQAGQKNLLVRVVLRHPARTLTRDEANRLRDRVYAALHRGDRLPR